MRDADAVRRSIGYVPQTSGVDVHATGRENLMLQGRVQQVPHAELRRRVDELMDTFGIGEFADRIVRTYSGGMKRRLDVALGLVHRPTVLFLDEPTTGLDPEARAAMWEELERLAGQEKLTILLTTHYLEEADHLARRIAIVSRGKVAVEGTPEALKRGLLGDSVTVELENGRMDEAARIVDRARRGRGGRSPDGRHLRARVEHGGQAVPGILSALEAEGIPVASVTVSRPSLDDVYLHYTGRDFRAEDEAGTQAVNAVVEDTLAMLVRHQRNFVRQPIWLVFALTQPIFWLLLYSQLFRRVVDLPGFDTDSYVQFLTPGIVVMTAFFGATWSGMSMIDDLDRGVIQRFLATPTRRSALIVSQVLHTGDRRRRSRRSSSSAWPGCSARGSTAASSAGS